MTAYTDDDVKAVAEALAHTDLVGMPYSAVAAYVLSQVADSIYKRGVTDGMRASADLQATLLYRAQQVDPEGVEHPPGG